MANTLLKIFGIIWYICLFGIIIPVSMVLVGSTLDQELTQFIPLYLYWNWPMVIIGGICLILALVFVILSSLTLNRYGKAYPWSIGSHVAYNPQELVTHGPYAIVRHPMTSSYLLFLVGIAFIYPSYVMLLWIIPLAAGLFYEYLEYTEEIRLRQWFGDEYDYYHKTTPSIIPRISRLWTKQKPVHVHHKDHHSS